MKAYFKLFICTMASVLVLSSCLKQKNEEELAKKLNFDWSLTETKSISSEGTYDVLNQEGDTIAVGLTGISALNIAKGDLLTAVPSSSVETKAPGSSTIYFPSNREYASFWVEDNFPFAGDKDFNDIVFGTRLVFKIEDGYVSLLQIDSHCKACGSSYDLLGIAVQLDGIDPASVSSNGGYFKSGFSNLFSVNDDYIEEGTTSAVIPVVGDFRSTFSDGRQTGMVNTFNNLPFHPTANQFSIKVSFNSPVTYEELYSSFNPFVIVGERGKEIHLKGKEVSSKFNASLYPTSFMNDDGFVWMMMIPKKNARYPIEMVGIYDAFPQFSGWVFQEYSSLSDWYMHPNEDKVYFKTY